MDGMCPGHPIEKQQTRTVVDLMLQRTSLEAVGIDLDKDAGYRQLARDRDLGSALDIAGEIRHRHTTFTCFLVTAGLSQPGIDQDDQSVSCAGLRVVGDIDAECL